MQARIPEQIIFVIRYHVLEVEEEPSQKQSGFVSRNLPKFWGDQIRKKAHQTMRLRV